MCRKINTSLAFITQSYFSVPKDVRLTSTDYLIMKINNKRKLQNIAINHSADIDYKDFMKIYRECTKEPFNVLAIDTTLPANDFLRSRKNLFDSYKSDSNRSDYNYWQKIKANQTQYVLDWLAANISALSSGELRKYEYLTVEDLGYRPSVLEQTKFDYSPLGKVFNKGLDKDDHKEGLLKKLKNIEKIKTSIIMTKAIKLMMKVN